MLVPPFVSRADLVISNYKIKSYDVAVLSNDTIFKPSFVEFRLLLRNGEKATAK